MLPSLSRRTNFLEVIESIIVPSKPNDHLQQPLHIFHSCHMCKRLHKMSLDHLEMNKLEWIHCLCMYDVTIVHLHYENVLQLPRLVYTSVDDYERQIHIKFMSIKNEKACNDKHRNQYIL